MTFRRPPPGEMELIAENGLQLLEKVYYLAFLRQTADVVVEELRRFFEFNPKTIDYRWRGVTRENNQIETADGSKSHIARERGDRPKLWPSVLVRSVGGDVQDLWLGQRHGTLVTDNPNYSEFARREAVRAGQDYDEPKYLEIGERRGGKLNLGVAIIVTAIGAGMLDEVDRVADLVIEGMVTSVRRELNRRAINVLPNAIRIGDPNVVAYQDSERSEEAVRVVTVGVSTEWYSDAFYSAPIVQEVLPQPVYLLGTEPRPGEF